MQNQKLTLSVHEPYAESTYGDGISLVPVSKQFDQVYKIFRVKLNPIYITEETRNLVLQSLSQGKMFVQIGEYTIMLNTITSIEPTEKRDREAWERTQEMKKMFAENDS